MKKIILIVATILLTVACSKNEDEPKNPTVNNEPFTFLKVGNEWTYGVYESGKLIGEFSRKIISENNGCFRVETGPQIFNWFIADDWWQQYEIIDGEHNVNHTMIFPVNCYVGQVWFRREILSVAETVIVPAGIFHNCIKISSTGFWGETSYLWYHKNYGLVMYEDNHFWQLLTPTITKLHSTNF